LLDYLVDRKLCTVVPLELQPLSADSLQRILLMGSTHLPIAGAAWKEFQTPSRPRAARSPEFGLRPRTDELLAGYVLQGWPAPPPRYLPEAGPIRQQIT
jgi:hypothetical protein